MEYYVDVWWQLAYLFELPLLDPYISMNITLLTKLQMVLQLSKVLSPQLLSYRKLIIQMDFNETSASIIGFKDEIRFDRTQI